ncbi:MAG: ATP/GTP-binding protein, partial [Chitinophagaceae bacterium]
MKSISLILSLALLLCLQVNGQQPQLVKLWQTDSVFKVPESVLYDEKNQVLYVTNIDGTDPWGKDDKGSIGKLGLDGKVIQVEWVKGFNAPKGMAVHNDILYVADLQQLISVDIKKGQIVNRLTIEGATGLNDVSVDSKGIIYVT